jgi:integrase
MAINLSEFIYSNKDSQANNLSKGIKSNKTFDKFLYQFRIDGKRFRKVFDLTESTNLNKRDRITRVNNDASKFYEEKEDELGAETAFTLDTKFHKLAEEYIKNKCTTGSRWTSEKVTMLNNYIYPYLKNKKASAIKEIDIDKIKLSMEISGHGIQNKDGCSPRTIRKVLLQVLNPILEYGHRNGALKHIPKIDVPKKPKKKPVRKATEKLSLLYTTIHTLYANDPFYRALFLFALFGRRWGEIKTLEWTDIDFTNNLYTIREEVSKIEEEKTFTLPNDIIEALNYFRDTQGLVFKSPKTGHELSIPKKQMQKIREASEVKELTLHYFRHIMASALGEGGMVNTVLSASLGHNNTQTVDLYYRTANHLKASGEATQAIEHIVEAKDA